MLRVAMALTRRESGWQGQRGSVRLDRSLNVPFPIQFAKAAADLIGVIGVAGDPAFRLLPNSAIDVLSGVRRHSFCAGSRNSDHLTYGY